MLGLHINCLLITFCLYRYIMVCTNSIIGEVAAKGDKVNS